MRENHQLVALGMALLVGTSALLGGCRKSKPASFPSSAAPVGEPTWQDVTSAEGAFKVAMPGNPQQKTESLGAPGDWLLHRWDSKWGDTIFIVSYVEAPKNAIRRDSDEKILERGRDTTVQNMKGKLTSSQSVSLGDHPGIEYEVEINRDLFIHTRAFVTPRREYTVQVIGTPDAVRSGPAKKFLDSFEILK